MAHFPGYLLFLAFHTLFSIIYRKYTKLTQKLTHVPSALFGFCLFAGRPGIWLCLVTTMAEVVDLSS